MTKPETVLAEARAIVATRAAEERRVDELTAVTAEKAAEFVADMRAAMARDLQEARDIAERNAR